MPKEETKAGQPEDDGGQANRPSRKLPKWALIVGCAILLQLFRSSVNVPYHVEDLPDPARNLLNSLNLTVAAERKLKEHHDAHEARLHARKIPGERHKNHLLAKHPVVLIPGIISCGLEAWQPGACLGKSYFRERIWGGVSMARSVLWNVTCWLDHLALDPVTGEDPPWKQVRAAEGLTGADYFVPGYWLWAKLIENAAAIGYNPSSLLMACYDWRLSYRKLERRDRYFTHLRRNIEVLVETQGEKVVVIGHSMGAQVWLYFMQWVSLAVGDVWVADHIHAFVSLAGPLLGASGPLGAVLSGEMETNAMLGPLNDLVNSAPSPVNYTVITDFYRSLGALGSLLPLGGDSVWGSAAQPTDIIADFVTQNGVPYGIDAILGKLRKCCGNHSFMHDFFHGARLPNAAPINSHIRNAASMHAVHNPLASALPRAPSMRIFCLYGIGIRTERSYRYKGKENSEFGSIDYHHNTVEKGPMFDGESPTAANFSKGVAGSNGDGTVPLLSHGYPCVGAWRELRAFNPSQVPVSVREYPDRPSSLWEDARGGPHTSKHVEILGNSEVIEDILHLLSGNDTHLIHDRVYSDIVRMSARVTKNLRAELGDGVDAAPTEA